MDSPTQIAHLDSWTGIPFQQRTNVQPSLPLLLQINLGKICNQACSHCHVDASPSRLETMTASVADSCIDLLDRIPSIDTVDLTGGAPEMHGVFKRLVIESRRRGKRVLDRCNLTILSQPGFEWVADFLSEHQIEVIASMPCYTKEVVDRQRGRGVFERSISGLKELNTHGYGDLLPLHLVYNPSGPSLPGSQTALESDFREQLGRYGIRFTGMYSLANMPIQRFLGSLLAKGKLPEYLDLLSSSFNPCAVSKLMCRSQISVGWDGKLYDCDFNQMLDLEADVPQDLRILDVPMLMSRSIRLGNHCYGCTAGQGSSCTGSLV